MAHEPAEHVFTKGDTYALFETAFLDSSNGNAALDLTGLTITLKCKGKRSNTVVGPISGVIQGSPTLGIVRFDCVTLAAASVDSYRSKVTLTDGSSKTQRTRPFFLDVEEDVS